MTGAGEVQGVFSRLVREARSRGAILIQPRMGWGQPARMRHGLSALKQLSPRCLGTITLDSYTRVRDYTTPLTSLEGGVELNGYPLISHTRETTRSLLDG